MPTAYQLRIELRDFTPAIYRDVLVDPATPLPKLHKLIQAAMGWEDVHMHGSVMETDTPLPHLLKAQQGFQPEDCGGPGGAEYWASVWHDKAHAEHTVSLEMFGEHEPGWLDFEALQKAVKRGRAEDREWATAAQNLVDGHGSNTRSGFYSRATNCVTGASCRCQPDHRRSPSDHCRCPRAKAGGFTKVFMSSHPKTAFCAHILTPVPSHDHIPIRQIV
jgi:hypothetical protein